MNDTALLTTVNDLIESCSSLGAKLNRSRVHLDLLPGMDFAYLVGGKVQLSNGAPITISALSDTQMTELKRLLEGAEKRMKASLEHQESDSKGRHRRRLAQTTGPPLAVALSNSRHKKAPSKGGHHLAPFYPLTHPGGKRNDLVQKIRRRSLVKGISIHAMFLMLPSGG